MSWVGIIPFNIFICFLQYSIEFCFIILAFIIHSISHVFLPDFNRYAILIFSTSTQLLSSEVNLFIYDFKRDKYYRKR